MRHLIILTLICILSQSNFAQNNVGIGTNTPNSSAKLDITSTNMGFLPPRVSIGNVGTWGLISGSGTEGMMVYNTNTATTGGSGAGFYYWSTATGPWVKISSSDWIKALTTNTQAIKTDNQYVTGYISANSHANGADNAYDHSVTAIQAPITAVAPGAATAVSTPTAVGVRIAMPGTSGTKWPVSSDFKIGSYATSGVNAQSQLDIALGNGGTSSPDVTVMSLLGNGNVGIGTISPTSKLEVAGQIKITGGTPGLGKTLISDAAGLATWVTMAGSGYGDNLGNHTATATLNMNSNQITNISEAYNNGWFRSNNGSTGWYSQPYGSGIYATAAGEVATYNGSFLRITGGANGSGNLRFDAANPYISASSYIVMPGGLYISGGTHYDQNQYECRGGIHNDNAAYLTIAGGTSSISYFTGNVGIKTTTPARSLEVNNALKFTNSSSDANDGVLGTAPFAVGLNIVGINTDGGGRKISEWGSILQQENPLYNNFINNTHIGTTVGPTSNLISFGDASYLQIGEWQADDRLTIKGTVWPETNGSYNCGDGSHYWYNIYADDHNYKGVFGYTFDVYDDLKLLNSIKSTRYMDTKLGHPVEVIDPATWPKCITNYEDKDYDPSQPFISGKKSIGLLIGAARQLDKETKQRDERLNAKTNIIAQAIGVDFNSTTTEIMIEDFGTVSSTGKTLTVSFSSDFKKQLNGKTPVVIISPTVSASDYYIASTTIDGFIVKTNSETLSFNWLAKAKVKLNVQYDSTEKHLDDIFFTEPIKLDGSYPEVPDRSPDLNKK